MITSISGGVKQRICHPIEKWLQTTWLLHLMIFHTTYITNLLNLWPMMDPLGHPHVESDMVHNSTHGLSIFDHPNLSKTKHQKVKPSPHVQTSEPWVNIHLHIDGGISQCRSVLCNGQVSINIGHDSFEQGCMLLTSLSPHIKIIQINHTNHIIMNGCQ
jgi:hypothetical protein